jgi:hypothetical protein
MNAMSVQPILERFALILEADGVLKNDFKQFLQGKS